MLRKIASVIDLLSSRIPRATTVRFARRTTFLDPILIEILIQIINAGIEYKSCMR